MDLGTLATTLETEHHEVDDALEDFVASREEAPLRRAVEELRRHIYVEEELLFPTLQAGGLMAPVLVMLREHGEIWRRLEGLEEALDGHQGSRAASLCQELLDVLQRHNAKEEPIIYPQVDRALDADGTDRALAVLDGGTMPPGWACRLAEG